MGAGKKIHHISRRKKSNHHYTIHNCVLTEDLEKLKLYLERQKHTQIKTKNKNKSEPLAAGKASKYTYLDPVLVLKGKFS